MPNIEFIKQSFYNIFMSIEHTHEFAFNSMSDDPPSYSDAAKAYEALADHAGTRSDASHYYTMAAIAFRLAGDRDRSMQNGMFAKNFADDKETRYGIIATLQRVDDIMRTQ